MEGEVQGCLFNSEKLSYIYMQDFSIIAHALTEFRIYVYHLSSIMKKQVDYNYNTHKEI